MKGREINMPKAKSPSISRKLAFLFKALTKMRAAIATRENARKSNI
jgi:hypothetical protein